MFYYDDPSGAAALPAPTAAGAQTYFQEENAGLGVEGAVVTADFMNMLTLEMLNLLAAFGIVPSKTTYNQVLTAIQGLINIGGGLTSIYTGAGPLDVTTAQKDIAVAMAAPAALTINLPAGAPIGFEVTIKDLGTNFFANHATVVPPSGTIDGGANYVMDVAIAAATFKKYGVNGANDIWGTK